MFGITPITGNRFAHPIGKAQPSAAPSATPKTNQPAFGLGTVSFSGKAAPAKPVTPKLDMAKPAGQRLDYFA